MFVLHWMAANCYNLKPSVYFYVVFLSPWLFAVPFYCCNASALTSKVKVWRSSYSVGGLLTAGFIAHIAAFSLSGPCQVLEVDVDKRITSGQMIYCLNESGCVIK